MAYQLRNMEIPTRTSAIFCNTVFGICDLPAVVPYSVPFPKPKPTAATRPAVSGKTPLKIVHISDIHVDLSYDVGANYNCTNSICCRPFTPADYPNVTQYPAGPYGNNKCDSPLSLEESMYAAIEQIVPDSSFTMFTGDLVEGAEWLTTKEEVVIDMNDVYYRMKGLKTV